MYNIIKVRFRRKSLLLIIRQGKYIPEACEAKVKLVEGPFLTD